ncbi:MAG: hypothetical protein ACI4RN_00830 [Oscillospiraceae bacterium]
MDENKKKKPEEESTPEENPKENDQSPAEEKPAEPPKDESKEEKPEEKSSDEKQAKSDNQTSEKGEGADKPEPPKPESEELPEKDDKDEEILRLKTQIAAMELGISGNCMEDAVAIAESYVKSGKASDINTALQSVVKKYPDMKAEGKDSKDGKSKGGFKVGADGTGDGKKADDEKLNNAFGIKKKKC